MEEQKKNIRNIIDKSPIDKKSFHIIPKQKQKQPIISITEKDLTMHQSISRLSCRQMHKQKVLWKSHLKEQGLKVKIAGQNKIDQLRKERVDDLFNIKGIIGNAGTEKNPMIKPINVVYCTENC